jgi:hypothetical protein
MEAFKPKTLAEITAEKADAVAPVEVEKEEPAKRGRKKAQEGIVEVAESSVPTVSVYVRSKGQPTEKGVNDNNEPCVYLKGFINGKPFKVECDKLVDVTPEIAAVLQPHIELGKGKPHRNPWDK